MHHNIYICDTCEKNYTTTDPMDLPPYWCAVQIAVSNKNGVVPVQERDVFSHFCSQECFVVYCQSDTFQERILTVDQSTEEGDQVDN